MIKLSTAILAGLFFAASFKILVAENNLEARLFKNENEKKGAYFCDSNLRGFSDRIDINSKSMHLVGNIKLQSQMITIIADDLTIHRDANNFSLNSNSILNRQMEIFIAKEPAKLENCQQGLVEIQDEALEYYARSNTLKWKKEADSEIMVFSGNPFIENRSLEAVFWGENIEVQIADQDINSIRILDNFRLTQKDQEISANQALINFQDRHLIAIGEIKLSIRNVALLLADKIEIDFSDKKKLVADSVKSDFFIIR